MNDMNVSAIDLGAFHDTCLANPEWPKQSPAKFDSGVWQAIELNHRFNCLLWNEEDLARRKNVPDSEIAANKRAIDGYNQKRNDAIEGMDEALLHTLSNVTLQNNAKLNSETAGAMMDRLSILSLKIHHMRFQTQRTDVDINHIETCSAKLAKLLEQRTDLQSCLDTLLESASQGQAYFKIYRQFKMYNDPNLNPSMYQEKNNSGK
ncbi:DUF4254 domain-containing protein [Sulfurirhabdus autotrophica]|uniref:Uncharacterized protein DUF4254 n=1 Tax=Sulfurirhabdus autotrophica TaxID=1706046 RepID=A0A4R3Y0W3_9PROT|nr:DUF4254 domain-containing protein [Sulfurirhabdus autotrophica]TCV84288.1 uncharacterized protein DUF4254 [Sulfurirhabdus autotrophica]